MLLTTYHDLLAAYYLLATSCLLRPACYLLLAVYCSQADLNGDGYSFPGFPTTLYELLYGEEEGT